MHKLDWCQSKRINKVDFNGHVEVAPGSVRDGYFSGADLICFVWVLHGWCLDHSFVGDTESGMEFEHNVLHDSLNFDVFGRILESNEAWPMIIANQIQLFIHPLVFNMNIVISDFELEFDIITYQKSSRRELSQSFCVLIHKLLF